MTFLPAPTFSEVEIRFCSAPEGTINRDVMTSVAGSQHLLELKYDFLVVTECCF